MVAVTVNEDINEIKAIVQRTTSSLLTFVNKPGRQGAQLRHAVGDLNAYIETYIADGTFAERLRACFALATDAGISLAWLDKVLRSLIAENPKALTAWAVVQNSTIFALAQQGRIIARTTFVSRDDVDETMRRMKAWFDEARDRAADNMENPSYLSVLDLAAAVTRYLTDVARPLPRMLRYDLPVIYPSLTASNYIYGEGDRAEELAAENRIVHPLFMKRTLRALSA
jgi:prophage DNA circulation protein